MGVRNHYWGIRPKDQPTAIRIEHADTAERACHAAFGRGGTWGFQYKDFGTSVSVIRNDKQRIALCTEEAGWTDFPTLEAVLAKRRAGP